MENLESHGILGFHFSGLESHVIFRCGSWKVMENVDCTKKVIWSFFFSCELKHNQTEIKIIFLENFYENGQN